MRLPDGRFNARSARVADGGLDGRRRATRLGVEIPQPVGSGVESAHVDLNGLFANRLLTPPVLAFLDLAAALTA